MEDQDRISLGYQSSSVPRKTQLTNYTASLEAFANGVTFDITAKNKAKRRFQVTSISSPNTGCSLYYIDDDTEVVVDESSATTDVTPATASATGRLLTRDHIGGLVDQLRNLNQRMQRVLDDIHKPRVKALGLLINRGILLHGFEGTGRTFVLDQLGQAPFQRVLRLDASYLAGGAAKMQDKIKNLFQEAKANQPSLILADDLQLIVSPSEHAVAAFLAKEMRTIHGQRVLVVATCRTPSELHTKLLDPGCLPVLVELPIPDLSARNKILDIMLRTEETQPGLAAAVSLRTHGFTGKDLKLLADRAKELAHTHPEERITSLTNSVDSNAPSADHQDHSGPNGLHETDDPDDLDGATVLTMESFELALIDIKPTALREIIFEKPKIGWADIGGSDDTKKHFDKALDWPIHHADILKKYNKRPPKGILLYGPPGCSKTLTAQAVASHYGLNFIAVKGGELISMYVGESERKIRELFSKARQAAPCVIFFDEIDSIASERQSDSSKGLNVLTTLLTEMDGFEALSGVLVLAATNKPDLLDAAIMRPGRFGMHVYLGPPNAAARREIFAIGLKGKPVEEGLDIDKLVDISDGYSGKSSVPLRRMRVAEARSATVVAAILTTVSRTTIDVSLTALATTSGLDDYGSGGATTVNDIPF